MDEMWLSILPSARCSVFTVCLTCQKVIENVVVWGCRKKNSVSMFFKKHFRCFCRIFSKFEKMNEPAYLPKYLYKMVYVRNMDYVLRTGLCPSRHPLAAARYVPIGDPHMSRDRAAMSVSVAPGGVLSEYVPFYFAGRMPMLHSMIRADEQLYRWQTESLKGCAPRFRPRGTWQYSQSEIVFVVCDFQRVTTDFRDWCFTDLHPCSRRVRYYNTLSDLDKLHWGEILHRNRSQRNKELCQAEFLFKGLLPIAYIDHLIVSCERTKKQMEGIVRQAGLTIPVRRDAGRKVFFPVEEEGRCARDFFPIYAPSDACDADEAIDVMMRRQSRFLELSSCTDVEEAVDLVLKGD